MNRSDRRACIALLWLWFFSGALWVKLGVFSTMLQQYSWISLALCGGLLFGEASHRYPAGFFRWLVGVMVAGFFAEVVGVNTGLLFGSYAYGPALGGSILGVPLSIGVAWGIVVLSAFDIATTFGFFGNARTLAVAVFTVVFDYCMEPAAMRLGFWTWEGNSIPVWNYVCWGILALMLSAWGERRLSAFRQSSSLAFHIVGAQLMFFGLIQVGV